MNTGSIISNSIKIMMLSVMIAACCCGPNISSENYSESKSKAIRLVDDGRCDKAVKLCRKLLEINEKDAEIYRLAAACFAKINQPDSAVFYYQGAIVFNPSDRQAYERIADIYYDKTDYHTAMTWYDKALQISYISPESYVRLAKIHQNWSEYAFAGRYYGYALAADPDNVEALYGLGTIQLQTGDTTAAISSLSKAAESGKHAGAAYKLGVINQQMKDYSKAIGWLEKCIEFSDDQSLKDKAYQFKMEIVMRMRDGQQ